MNRASSRPKYPNRPRSEQPEPALAEKSTISIIVPVLNEEQSVPIFVDRVLPMLDTLCRDQLSGGTFEIIFIDDGSTDGTAGRILQAARSREEIKLVRLSRNFGKE